MGPAHKGGHVDSTQACKWVYCNHHVVLIAKDSHFNNAAICRPSVHLTAVANHTSCPIMLIRPYAAICCASLATAAGVADMIGGAYHLVRWRSKNEGSVWAHVCVATMLA